MYILFFSALFLLVFMNGYSDAPNSVASAVGTGVLSLGAARRVCAVSDAFGVILFSLVLPAVAKTSGEVAKFGSGAMLYVCVAMLSAVLWAAAAAKLGIPTSEGHAMSASLAGAAYFSGGEIPTLVWGKIMLGFLASSVASAVISRLILHAGKGLRRRRIALGKESGKRLQCMLCAVCAFLHGAQDGQKFSGILLLGCDTETPPLYGVLCIAAVMAIGSLVCNERIVRRVAEKTARPTLRCGISADISSVIVILLFTLIGIPVSTSNVKVCSLVGASEGDVSFRSFIGMVAVWLATFPVCFLIGGILTRILI